MMQVKAGGEKWAASGWPAAKTKVNGQGECSQGEAGRDWKQVIFQVEGRRESC